MCFSTTASLTTAAILIPAGLYCIKSAKQLDNPYWAIAMLPFIFGLQQLLEGGVWFSLENGNTSNAHLFSLGFVLFSHLFWLGWNKDSGCAVYIRFLACTRTLLNHLCYTNLFSNGFLLQEFYLAPQCIFRC